MLTYKTYKPLIERFLNSLKMVLGKDLLSVALFGSVARNCARKDSDIDLIVLLKKKNFKLEEKLTEINIKSYDWKENKRLQKKGIITKIYNIMKTEEELRNNPLILLDLLDHGKILYDPENIMRKILLDLKLKLKELRAKKILFRDGRWCWDLKPDWRPGEIVEIKI